MQGLRELAAVAQGRLELEAARALIAAGTRQYAKRQRTWFRHQLPELRACPQPGEDLDPLALFAGLGPHGLIDGQLP